MGQNTVIQKLLIIQIWALVQMQHLQTDLVTIIVLAVLNQVIVFQSQLGPSLSNEQFLDDCILTGTPYLTAICFSTW